MEVQRAAPGHPHRCRRPARCRPACPRSPLPARRWCSGRPPPHCGQCTRTAPASPGRRCAAPGRARRRKDGSPAPAAPGGGPAELLHRTSGPAARCRDAAARGRWRRGPAPAPRAAPAATCARTPARPPTRTARSRRRAASGPRDRAPAAKGTPPPTSAGAARRTSRTAARPPPPRDPRESRAAAPPRSRCRSFHTNIRSGGRCSRPLVLRLSQLKSSMPTGIPSRLRARDQVGLRRAEVHDRRQQQHVGLLLAEEGVVERIGRKMLLGQAQDRAQPFDLLLRDLPQHVRGVRVVHPQAQLLAQLVDGARLQLLRAMEARLLVVQAVAEAAEQRRRLGPRRRCAPWGPASARSRARPGRRPAARPWCRGAPAPPG